MDHEEAAYEEEYHKVVNKECLLPEEVFMEDGAFEDIFDD